MRRGLIEATSAADSGSSSTAFSAAMRRGLIEARKRISVRWRACRRFPRPCAAASLKLRVRSRPLTIVLEFSAAMRRGLIEAPRTDAAAPASASFPRPCAAASLKPPKCLWVPSVRSRFPRPCAAASLKHPLTHRGEARTEVFRGHAPRPH